MAWWERYKKGTGYKILGKAVTPGFPRTEMPDKKDDEKPGVYGSRAPQDIGGALYLARGTQGDCLEPTGAIGRHVKDWSLFDDRRLHRYRDYRGHGPSDRDGCG